MKYESTILKRLIDTYGVVGNPRYISEIIKEFIVRGKECFPNLFTYQADWLAHIDEFGLTPEYTVSYTGQHIYAPNTREKPVKSAILKGCTGYRDIDTGEVLETFEEGRNLELVSVKMPVLTTTGKNLFDGEYELDKYLKQDGTTASSKNWATTKNYIRVKPNTTYTQNTHMNSAIVYVVFYDKNKNIISAEKGTDLTSTYNSATYTTPNNCYFIKTCYSYGHLGGHLFQIEEGSVVTTYEPYKTNILTVNEPVELRGIGDVRDTLDCLTGEVVQRVGEYTIDGSEDWKRYEGYNVDGYNSFVTTITGLNNSYTGANAFISGDFKSGSWNDYVSKKAEEIVWNHDPNKIGIKVKNETASNAEELKTFLASNPIRFKYKLATESIKTVDLTIHDKDHQKVERLTSFEGGTHFTTSSQDGSLLPTLTVDVVTDLEKTLMVCSLEGNTM